MRAKSSCLIPFGCLALPLSATVATVATVAASQQPGALTGHIIDASKAPLRNAHARLLGTQLQTVTDANGTFKRRQSNALTMC